MRQIFLMTFLLLFSGQMKAQNYREDFDHIRNAFNSSDKALAFDISFRYYPNASTKIATDSMFGQFVVRGSSYSYKLADLELISNDHYYTAINHKEHTITIENRKDIVPQFSFAMIDSFASLRGVKVNALPAKLNLKGYDIEGLQGDISSCEVWFNPGTYRISTVTLHYPPNAVNASSDRAKVVISYNNYHYHTISNEFSENKYVTRVGMQWQQTSAYHTYRLVDHTMLINQ